MDYGSFALLATAILLFVTFGVVFVGAPYVPTKKQDIERAITLAGLAPGSLIVDLGSGDGRVLLAAARKGFRGIGYELSPLIAMISRYRLRRYEQVRIISKNFWGVQLPQETGCVFVFLAGPFMGKLGRFMQKQAIEQDRPIKLISYGFAVPGHVPLKTDGALKLYVFKP